MEIILHYFDHDGQIKGRRMTDGLGEKFGRSGSGVAQRYEEKLAYLEWWDFQQILNYI